MLRRSLLIIAIVTAVTAWFSLTFFNLDEHYQILEFMSYKLGITKAAELPWEFQSQIRPWLQPFFYYLATKTLMAAGLRDMFHIVFVLRLLTGCLSLTALAVFAKAMLEDFQSGEEKLFFAGALPFLGYLPYLFVRTSSETFSAAFFTLGMALVIRPTRQRPWRRFAAAGFFVRARFRKPLSDRLHDCGARPVAAFDGAGLAGAAGGFFRRRAGRDRACPAHRPLGLWRVEFSALELCLGQSGGNIAAGRYGSQPFFAYPYLVLGTIFLPIAIVLVISMFAACLRNPRHAITWVTVPFFVIQSFVAHKEERFLFPLSILATVYPVMAFAPSKDRWFPAFAKLWPYRHSIAAKAVAALSVATMLFMAVYPFGITPHLRMARYLYRQFPAGLALYEFDRHMPPSIPYTVRTGFRAPGSIAQISSHPCWTGAPSMFWPKRPLYPRANFLPAPARS